MTGSAPSINSALMQETVSCTVAYMDTLRDAIGRAGGAARTARRIGVSPQTLNNWLKRKAVPPDRALALSAALGLRPHEVCPDVYLQQWTIPDDVAREIVADAAA